MLRHPEPTKGWGWRCQKGRSHIAVVRRRGSEVRGSRWRAMVQRAWRMRAQCAARYGSKEKGVQRARAALVYRLVLSPTAFCLVLAFNIYIITYIDPKLSFYKVQGRQSAHKKSSLPTMPWQHESMPHYVHCLPWCPSLLIV